MNPSAAHPVLALLNTLCAEAARLTPSQLRNAGEAARRLLRWGWTSEPRNSWMVTTALRCVCRTFASCPDESTALLRQAIEPAHLAAYGFEEMHWVTSELHALMAPAPHLVAEIFEAVLAHEERSDEATPMGNSRLLSMRSNRRQDFEMAQWELGEIFPAFLSAAPEMATRTLMHVMNRYVERRHSHSMSEQIEKQFELFGTPTRVVADYSVIWDSPRIHDNDAPMKMLGAFETYLSGLARAQADLFRHLLAITAAENRVAVVWKRLLELAAREPSTVGVEVASLGTAEGLLTMYDTTTAAGTFLAAVFSHLLPEERERIERAVLAIPEGYKVDGVDAAGQTRARLLGCLPPALLVTSDVRELQERLQAAGAVPNNEPPFRLETFSSPCGARDYLRDQGVPVDSPANRRLQELEAPVTSFSDQHRNIAPLPADILTIAPALDDLDRVIAEAGAQGADQAQDDHARGVLVQGCADVAKCADIVGEPALLEFIRRVLLDASMDPDPEPDPRAEESFDRHPAWGSLAIRVNASKGLMLLASRPQTASDTVMAALDRLRCDPVSAVRYQIAVHLPHLYQVASTYVWEAAEHFACEDPSQGVLSALVEYTLTFLLRSDAARAAELARRVLSRASTFKDPVSLQEHCISLLSIAYVWRGDVLSSDPLFATAEAGQACERVLRSALFTVRSALTYGSTQSLDSAADAVRQRAFGLFHRFLDIGLAGLRAVEAAHAGVPVSSWPNEDLAKAKRHAAVINYVATELYYASGAYERRKPQGQNAPTEEQLRRFLGEARPLLDALSHVAFPSVTHHLLQILELMIPLDPSDVFTLACRALEAGKEGGYQFESQGIDLFVRFVTRYLAEYRPLLQQDVDLHRRLLDALDVFVRAGWPAARRLVYRLDELFR